MERIKSVPQESVLAPIMFLVYVSDMTEGVRCYISLFADDAKLLRTIRTTKIVRSYRMTNKIYERNKAWDMEFNAKKCYELEIGKSAMRPSWTYKLGENIISIAKQEKSLEVVIQDNSSPGKHINRILDDTFRML